MYNLYQAYNIEIDKDHFSDCPIKQHVFYIKKKGVVTVMSAICWTWRDIGAPASLNVPWCHELPRQVIHTYLWWCSLKIHTISLGTYTAVLSRSTVRPIQKSSSCLEIWMHNKTPSENENRPPLIGFVWQVLIMLTTFHSRILSASVVIDTRSLFSFWQCWRACSIDILVFTILYSFPFHFSHWSEVQL